jgi:hypothetical protein
MARTAQQMKSKRGRHRARGLRELRLLVPDARSKAVQRGISKQVARLDRSRELEALRWTESASEFDSQ